MDESEAVRAKPGTHLCANDQVEQLISGGDPRLARIETEANGGFLHRGFRRFERVEAAETCHGFAVAELFGRQIGA
jgi:hypothetical protein